MMSESSKLHNNWKGFSTMIQMMSIAESSSQVLNSIHPCNLSLDSMIFCNI